MIVNLLVLLLLLGAVVVVLTAEVAGARVSDRDVAWLAGGAPPPTAAGEVYARYLRRHRRHRLAGGLFGIAFALVVGIRWYQSVTIGISGSPLADALLCGLSGVLGGALSAETFRLSEPRTTRVAASLAPREPAPEPGMRHWARGLAVGVVVLGAVVLVAGGGSAALAVALTGVALGLLAEATLAAVVGRRRPILSRDAAEVDRRLRAFAGASVTRLQLAAAVLVAGWVVLRIPMGDGSPWGLVQVPVALASLAGTVVLLQQAAPRPPRGWEAVP